MSAHPLTGLTLRALESWAEHGVPDDPVTRRHIIDDVLPELWAAYVEADALVVELTDLVTQMVNEQTKEVN